MLLNFKSKYILNLLHIISSTIYNEKNNTTYNYIIAIFEHVPKGYISLAERISKEGFIREYEAKFIFLQITIALNHIHFNYNYVHADLNCMTVYINDSNEILLVSAGEGFGEFGISKGYIGDYNCYPLELFNGGLLSYKSDIFALGSILYTMLSGFYPIPTSNVDEYAVKIGEMRKLNFNHQNMWNVSLECKGLLMELMHHNQELRPNTSHILISKYMQGLKVDYTYQIDYRIYDTYIAKMTSYISYNYFERILLKIVARKIKSMNKKESDYIFNLIDREHKNYFSIDEFKLIYYKTHTKCSFINNLNTLSIFDVFNKGILTYEEFDSLMSLYEKDSLTHAFEILLSELDYERNGELYQNEFKNTFKKYDYHFDFRLLKDLFPDGKSYITNEYFAEVYYKLFFKGTLDEPDPEHAHHASKIKMIIQQLCSFSPQYNLSRVDSISKSKKRFEIRKYVCNQIENGGQLKSYVLERLDENTTLEIII